jgi:hypothetical protein
MTLLLHQRLKQHFYRVQSMFSGTIHYLVTATGAGRDDNRLWGLRIDLPDQWFSYF